jgi:hypothetical protein
MKTPYSQKISNQKSLEYVFDEEEDTWSLTE